MENFQPGQVPSHSIVSGVPIVSRLYGEPVDIDDYLQTAMFIINRVGGIYTGLYEAKLTIDSEGYTDLPCNVEIIEAVSTDRLYDGSIANSRIVTVQLLNSPGEVRQLFDMWYNNVLEKSKYQFKGRLVQYSLDNGRLSINKDLAGIEVFLYYKGPQIHHDGFPCITEPLAYAIAHRYAYERGQLKAMRKIDGGVEQMQIAEKNYLQAVNQAKTPVHMSQNEINQVLDSMVRWGRKTFNKTYPINV